MKRIAVALIGIAAVGYPFGSTAWGEPPKMSVAVHGLRIGKPSPDEDDMAFPFYSGTTVVLLVTEPGGGLVAFDSELSRVKSFVDDKGKDLWKAGAGVNGKDARPGNWAFTPVHAMSKDREHCNVEFSVPDIPTPKATTLNLAGTLVFKTAREKKEFRAEKVALRAGTTVNAGKIPLTIKRVGKPRFGGDAKSSVVEFQAKQPLDAVSRIQFFDASGKKIESREGMRSLGSSLDDRLVPSNYEATVEYELKEPGDTATIVFTCWEDVKEVVVPFDVKVSVGL